MGVDTCGRLLGHVRKEEVINYIYHNWDKDVSNMVNYDDYNHWKERNYDWIKEIYDDNIYSEHGFISFKYKDEQRSLFYCYNSYSAYENLEFYKKHGLENMVKSETTFISLGKWGNSIEIIKELVSYFGGYIDEDDCDDKEYYYIPSTQPDRRKEFPPVIYLTQEELNEHFGGIVVIKD